MVRTGFLALLCLVPPAAVSAATAKVTIMVRGVATDDDAKRLRQALKKIDGVQFDASSVERGEQGRFKHYFTPPFVIQIGDTRKTDIGVIAEAVGKVATSKRDDLPPSLNLVLYDPLGGIEEDDVANLRQTLANVNGVDAQAPGGTGAKIQEDRFWVRLDRVGGASLSEIRSALENSGLKLSFEKP